MSSKGIEPLTVFNQFFYREPPLPIGSLLPARLHELYPLDLVPLDCIPLEGEEDFIVLNEVADRIIHKLDSVRGINFNFHSVLFTKKVSKDYTRKIFPGQVIVTVNTLPANNSRCCPFWTCPSGTDFLSYSDLLIHLGDAHPDMFVHAIKLSKPLQFLMLIMPLILEQLTREERKI